MQWKRTSKKNFAQTFGNKTLIAKYELLRNNVPNGFSFLMTDEKSGFWCVHYIQGGRTTTSKCSNIKEALKFIKQIP